MIQIRLRTVLVGSVAGSINGLFGAGGGMILVPLLNRCADLDDSEIFPASISIILPISCITLMISSFHGPIPWSASLPYLIGSAIGGIIAGFIGTKIPVLWLHRTLGILILYGGWRYLC